LLAAAQAEDERIQQAWAGRTSDAGNPDHAVAGPDGGGTLEGIQPNAAGDLTIFRHTKLSPTTGSASVNEPSHATEGQYVFYTGNWYAARSTDGGQTWGYLDPYADFPNFCCDQDVVHDTARSLFMWYRQGIYDSGNGRNNVKISASTNGMASYWTYTIYPTTLSAGFTNQWFDYPHMELSNDYLYITTNMFSGAGSFLRMVIMKMPLGPIAAAQGFGFTYWTATDGWSWTPVQGATTRMYWGDTYDSAGTFRVFWNDEDSGSAFYYDRAVPAWTFTNRNGNCPVPSGVNPCARPDQRITNGWVASNVVGFFWNVKEGGGFNYPYVESATFNQSDLTYLGRPYIWNSAHAFQYASVGPNRRGDVGIGVHYLGGGLYPYFCVGIDDDYNAAPPGWEITCPVASTGWTSNAIGDYTRTRAFDPEAVYWTASAHNYANGVYNPKFLAFGRGREQRAFNRWNDK
jgi:hypothetical protein